MDTITTGTRMPLGFIFVGSSTWNGLQLCNAEQAHALTADGF